MPEQRRGLLIPAVMTLAMLGVFISLGTWQIERKAWKEGLIDTLTRRLEAQPVELPGPADWGGLDAGNAEFCRVRLNVQFQKPQDKAQDALVYTSGSQIRDDVKGQGFFVFSPAKLPGGGTIVINRGFTPDKNYPPAEGSTQGIPQEIVGVLRWPEPPSWFTPGRDSAGTWYARDHLAMAQAQGWGQVAPFYIEMEDPVPPGGVPHPSVLKVLLRNEHLQYAITWFGLAAVTVIMFAIWVRRRRETSADASPPSS